MKTLYWAVILLAAIACSKPEEPKSSDPAPTTSSSAATSATTTVSAAASATQPSDTAAKPNDLTWDVPPGWTNGPTPPNSFRKASYVVKRAAGDPEDGEMSVISAGGTLDDNISRWEGQFHGAKAKRTPQKVGDLNATIVEIHGQYQGMGMAGGNAKPTPRDQWAMLAAIVDLGDSDPRAPRYFFKLTGPEKTVTAARPDFEKLVSSVRGK